MGQLRVCPFCTLAPLVPPFRRGFLVPAKGLRGSHCGAALFEALSCGRDRVRWAVPLAVVPIPRLAVEPAAWWAISTAAGSLVLRRMDRRGHKRGLVWAKKHGTKSGSSPPLLANSRLKSIDEC